MGLRSDRLAEIERTIAEYGGGGEGTLIRWLIDEVKRLRVKVANCEQHRLRYHDPRNLEHEPCCPECCDCADSDPAPEPLENVNTNLTSQP